MKSMHILALGSALFALAPIAANAQDFTFSTVPISTFTPDAPGGIVVPSDTIPGLTATFSVVPGGGGSAPANQRFQTIDNSSGATSVYGENLSGAAMANVDGSDDVLNIVFNGTVTALTLQFATVPLDGGLTTGPTLELTNGTDTTSSTGLASVVVPGDFIGTLTIAPGTPFSSVQVFFTSAPSISDTFAIDSIVLRGAVVNAVPEPGVVAMLAGLGVSGLGLLARRRARRA